MGNTNHRAEKIGLFPTLPVTSGALLYQPGNCNLYTSLLPYVAAKRHYCHNYPDILGVLPRKRNHFQVTKPQGPFTQLA